MDYKKTILIDDWRIAAAITTYNNANELDSGHPVKYEWGELVFIYEDAPELHEVIEKYNAGELQISASDYYETLMQMEGIAPYPFGYGV